MIKLINVASSNVQAIGYDPDTLTLLVLFRSAELYEGRNISADLFDEFLASDSKGKFVNKRLRTILKRAPRELYADSLNSIGD